MLQKSKPTEVRFSTILKTLNLSAGGSFLFIGVDEFFCKGGGSEQPRGREGAVPNFTLWQKRLALAKENGSKAASK